MSYILSEQEKSLLSAFHDGETNATEATEVRRLLERSPEARAWLRDARSVRTMSVEATLRVPLPLTSVKLTGPAIAAAAAKKGVLSGGGFFAAARSPLGLAGAAALLIAGAIWTVNDPAESTASRSGGREIAAVVQPNNGTPVTAINASNVPDMAEKALMIPPVTLRDLISFAVNGSVPINQDRTRFMGMEEGREGETAVIREIEGEIGTLEQSHIQALDSLARLLRSSIIRVQGNTCAVRSDLPDLRMAVISHLEKAQLSKEIRGKLTTARHQSEENKTQLRTSLEAEIRSMEERLLATGEEPYVLIQSNEIVETPTGDGTGISVLRMIGPRTSVINIDPESIRITEPNPHLTVTYATAEPIRKKAPNKPGANSGTTARSSGVGASNAEQNNAEWQRIATEPFMQSITISLFAGEGVTVVISNEDDTTWNSGTLFIGDELYSFSAQVNALTNGLNAQISRIAGDRSKSPEVRAREIYNRRREYRKRVQLLLDEMNRQNTIPVPNSDSMRNNEGNNPPDPLEEAAQHEVDDEDTLLESTCMPWEDCTGLG